MLYQCCRQRFVQRFSLVFLPFVFSKFSASHTTIIKYGYFFFFFFSLTSFSFLGFLGATFSGTSISETTLKLSKRISAAFFKAASGSTEPSVATSRVTLL